ncbi:glucose-6-phosphatase 3-like [Antedon mediterranea]|uniref:glucose-6-phosphatase 3-like n=1 Tax=Antedon mediterranea TaxID=105859 RepID=UPI003AF57B8D
MDDLCSYEIDVIYNLQNTLAKHDTAMLYISHLSDPPSSFLFYFPIVFSLNQVVGLKVLWAAVISEWMNAILKLCLFGQRPYWWVQETDVYSDGERPHLKIYEQTCETGPGSPSGHCMVTIAVWFIMMAALAADLEKTVTAQQSVAPKPANLKEEREADKKIISPAIPWGLLAAVGFTVSLSRVFIATHFPHQTIIGLVVGVIIGIAINKIDVTKFDLKTYTMVTIFIGGSVVGQCVLMEQLGYDPTWSIKLAAKWCPKSEWVHLDTTAFFAISRDLGSLFFVGLTQSLLRPKETLSSPGKFLALVFSVSVCQLIEMVPLDVEDSTLFCCLGALKYGAIASCVIIINSILVKLFMKDKKD